MMIRMFISLAVWSSLLSAIPAAGHASSLENSSKGDVTTGPTPTSSVSTGTISGTIGDTEVTFYELDGSHVVDEIKCHDPVSDATKIETKIVRAAADSGKPDDLPDLGIPLDHWHGVGGPWNYTNTTITYKYSCGNWATANAYRSDDGSNRLRNMGEQTALTQANSWSRHWCKDTTAMYVHNELDTDLVIPYYNIGWMTERLERLCCYKNGGKSGQMWHYRLNYSVVLGYGNCNHDATTASPYPYLSGNNPRCIDESTMPDIPPFRTAVPEP